LNKFTSGSKLRKYQEYLDEEQERKELQHLKQVVKEKQDNSVTNIQKKIKEKQLA